MKRTLIFLAICHAVGILSAAVADSNDNDANNRDGEDRIGQRRFTSRRYYNRSINVFDEAPEKQLNIPDRSERPRSGLGQQGFDEAPAPDIGRRTGSPPPSQGSRREQIERPAVGRNWLVDAVLNTEGNDSDDEDPLRQPEEDERASGWGWLADSLNLFQSEENGEAEQLEDDDDAELTDEQREFLLQLLGLADEQAETTQRQSDEGSRSEDEDIFVDHRVDRQERDIFIDHLEEAAALQERDRDEVDRASENRDEFESRLAQIFGNERQDDDSDDFRLESLNRDEAQGLASEREQDFRFEPIDRGTAFNNQTETASSFRSAFDHNMEHRLRSPLNGQRSEFGDPWNRRDEHGGSSYGTPIQPIFGGGQQAGFEPQQQWGTDFDRGRDEGRRRERALPSSIEQWR